MFRLFSIATAGLLAASAAADEANRVSPLDAASNFYREGQRHYQLAEYDEAIAAFKKAYQLGESPELLFDIAQAFRKKGPGSCVQALELYQNYVRAESVAALRARAFPHIREVEPCAKRELALRSQVAPDPAAAASSPSPSPLPSSPAAEVPPSSKLPPPVPEAAPPPSTPPPPPAPAVELQQPPPPSPPPPAVSVPPATRPRRVAVAPWLVGAGAVVGAGGAVLAWSVSWAEGCKPYCSPGYVNGLEARAYSGYALSAVGVAVLATGLGLWLWPHHESTKDVDASGGDSL